MLVAIELGGLIYSDASGQSFSDHPPSAQLDPPRLAWHPRAEGRAYEAAGGGAAWSRDGGRSWEPADRGRDRHYCWALAADPDDPDRWYVSAAPGPREAHGGGPAQARLYRWQGEGPWEPIQDGLPSPLDSMPYAVAASPDGGLFAGLADGRIFHSADRGDTWAALPVQVDAIVAMEASPEPT